MSNEAILFQDDLKNSLADDWAWLRQHSGYWRHTSEGLEIRVDPGKAADVKTALLRPAPDRARGAFAIAGTKCTPAADRFRRYLGGSVSPRRRGRVPDRRNGRTAASRRRPGQHPVLQRPG